MGWWWGNCQISMGLYDIVVGLITAKPSQIGVYEVGYRRYSTYLGLWLFMFIVHPSGHFLGWFAQKHLGPFDAWKSFANKGLPGNPTCPWSGKSKHSFIFAVGMVPSADSARRSMKVKGFYRCLPKSACKEYLYIYLSIYLSMYLSSLIYLPILSYLILSYPILSYPSTYLILSYPILSYLSTYLILSYPVLSYPVLSYPVLSYPILSYPSIYQHAYIIYI